MITLLFIYFVLNLPLPAANFCLGALQAAGLFVVEFNEVTQKPPSLPPEDRIPSSPNYLPGGALPTSLTLPSSGYQPHSPDPPSSPQMRKTPHIYCS